VSRAGWDTVNLLALPLLAAVAIAAVWLAMRKSPAAA
jgi:hypothetical protein